MTLHTTLLVVGLLLYLFLAAPKLGWLSASSLLVYMQFNLVLGTLLAVAPDLPADRTYARLILWAFLSIIVVTIIMSLASKSGTAVFTGRIVQVPPSAAIRWMIALSIAVSSLYYLAVGYIAVFEAIESLVSGTNEDIAGLRLESYSGSQYFFPGYVNQFKNTILPSLVMVTIIYLFATKRSSRWLVSVPLSTVAIVFLLGTGQRGAFVLFLVTLTVAIFYLDRKRFFRRMLLVVTIAGPVLLTATFALGRSRDDIGNTSGILEQVGVLLRELYERISSDNQGAGIVAFRYIETQPLQWGAQWGDALFSLLPGVSSTHNLDSHVFSLVYGSSRGTMPPSIWGSAYYNWGTIGVVVLAVVLALIAFKLSTCMRDRKVATPLEIVGFAGVCAVLASWIAGSPTFLLNNGIAAFGLLWWWGRRQSNRAVEQLTPSDLYGHRSLVRTTNTGPRRPLRKLHNTDPLSGS